MNNFMSINLIIQIKGTKYFERYKLPKLQKKKKSPKANKEETYNLKSPIQNQRKHMFS